MSALSPRAPTGWTWKRTIAAGAMGAGAIAVGRAAVFLLIGAFAPAEPFSDEASFELDGDEMRSASYDIEVNKAELVYEATASSGLFSIYLIPSASEELFFDEVAFEHFAGQAAANVDAASGAVVLPKGSYSLALACESIEGCDVAVRLTISPTRAPVEDALVSTLHVFQTPTLLWDHASFSLDPWSYVDEPEFYSRVAGTLEMDVTSDRPVEVCLLEQEQYELWLDEEGFHALRCDEAALRFHETVAIPEGEYALVVLCTSDPDPCEGTLHVVFRPDT